MIARQLGIAPRIACVEGDGLLDRLDNFLPLFHTETGTPLSGNIRERALFANVYLGARPIVEALRGDADLVIIRRVADASLFLAPMIYELGWDWEDWDRLALGAVTGQLLKGGAQVTGGNHAGRWQDIPDLDRIGRPIAEVSDSAAIITKTPHAGGRVSFDTVREQLLSKVHNPHAYITPDVIVDLSAIRIEEIDRDQVRLTVGRGYPRPARYKLTLNYLDGYLGQGMIGYSWPDALDKAQAAETMLRRQIERLRMPIDDLHFEYLGYNALHRPFADAGVADALNEVYLRLAIRTRYRHVAERISRLFPPLERSGPPGATECIGVESVRELMSAWTSLVARDPVDAGVIVKWL
jgi:hypothetical protein